MENLEYLANLIADYGETFYGSETLEYVAQPWTRALPKAGPPDFPEWFDCGFWAPDVAQALSDAGVFPWEVPANTVHDLCNGDLSVAAFLKTWRY